jgi:hypothetical protein
MKKQSQQGFIKIALGIVLVVVAGLAFYYFTSDVGKGVVGGAINEYSKWTDKNIAENPTGYLDFLEMQTEEKSKKLEINEIAVARNRGTNIPVLKAAKDAVENGEKVLAELKTAYQTATANSSFPFTIASNPGMSYDKESAEFALEGVFDQIELQKQIVQDSTEALGELDEADKTIRRSRIQLDGEKQKIATARIKVQNNKVNDDLRKQLSDMRGSLQVITDTTVFKSSKTTGAIPDITKKSQSVDKDKLSKILGQ